MYDLVIRGGTVVDGTGADGRTADVAIEAGRIAAVGKVASAGRRELDADGALVTPGFVDVHAHYDGQATWDSQLAPSSWHGVTTVIAGNCGVGFAPVREGDRDRLISLMEGVEDIPGAALHEGIRWDWESFPDFLDALERRSRDIDLGVLVPHGPVRLYVMGERGALREAASAGEIAEMGRLVREGVEAGAFGFSTSRTLNHRTSTGDPTPTLGAAADELVGIARAMRASGRGAFEVVADFEDLDAEFGAFRRVAAESGAHTFVSLNQNKKGGYRAVLDRIEAAVADGLPMTAQVAVRPIGVLMSLASTIHPFLLSSVWGEVGADREKRIAALRDASFRTRLAESVAKPGTLIGSPDTLFRLGDPPDYEPAANTSLAAQAARAGRDAIDLLCDWLLADDATALVYWPIFNYAAGDLEAQRALLEHPATIVGLADGGAHVGTICDASFPTTLLAHWGRDRTRGPKLPLPWLVKAQTADTADAYGLGDRGRLAPGLRADLNVIDFERLRLRPPRLESDLPAGGKRFLQRAEGYLATLVAGRVTYEDGEATGELPGRLVRSQRIGAP